MSDISNMDKSTTYRFVKDILIDIEQKSQDLVSLQREVKQLYKELEKAHKLEVKEVSKRKKNFKKHN